MTEAVVDVLSNGYVVTDTDVADDGAIIVAHCRALVHVGRRSFGYSGPRDRSFDRWKRKVFLLTHRDRFEADRRRAMETIARKKAK